MRPLLEQFYAEIFPSLQTVTAPRPDAIHLVDYAVAQGHTLVVATNPIFPRQAILHRLDWAGLPAERTPFALITDYEHFHFSKPNPAFFAEILAQLGWPAQPAVAIGNSLEDDLLPAARLGLPVFWVNPATTSLPSGLHPLSDGGSLADVIPWLEKIESADLRQEYNTPEALLAILKSTPAALDTLSASLTEQQWRERPEPKEWSLTEIFCHLRDSDQEVNLPRLEKVATEDNPFLPGVNTDTWADERDYLHQDGPAALSEFIEVRSRLVEHLEAMPGTEWQRTARHAIFGPTTLKELITFTVTHDRTHIDQSMKTLRALSPAQQPVSKKTL
jgi:beta-phosphoglucomutase-like phosphatase (HAD superfamily)